MPWLKEAPLLGDTDYVNTLKDCVDEIQTAVDSKSPSAGPGSSQAFSTGALTVAANSSSDALKITQTGSGNALLIEDSTTPDATPFVVTADGKTIVGHTLPVVSLGVSPTMQVIGNGISSATYLAAGYVNDATSSANIYLNKSRSTNLGVLGTIVQSNDVLGGIRFLGDDGTAFIRGAQILAEVDGTPGTNDMPGRLVFATTSDGASSPTERMRIDSAGEVSVTATTDSTSTTTGALVVAGGVGVAGALNVGGATTVAANSSNDALKITQTGPGHALLIEDDTSPDASPFVITSGGNVVVGGTIPIPNASGVSPKLNVIGEGSSPANIAFHRLSDSALSAAACILGRSRSLSASTRTIVQSGDNLGGIFFAGDDGTNFINAAQIQSIVEGTPASGLVSGSLLFLTRSSGDASLTQKMRIDNGGQVSISAATNTTSSTTGALVVAGGVGIGAGLNVAGTVTLPSTTSIGNVSATELGYLDGVTSDIQTQFTGKLSMASTSGTVKHTVLKDNFNFGLELASTDNSAYTKVALTTNQSYLIASDGLGSSCSVQLNYSDLSGKIYAPGGVGISATNTDPDTIDGFISFEGIIKKQAFDTPPASATDTGTLGEIRITATHIYVCSATNTWVRTALTSW